jgi:hypothetical protein
MGDNRMRRPVNPTSFVDTVSPPNQRTHAIVIPAADDQAQRRTYIRAFCLNNPHLELNYNDPQPPPHNTRNRCTLCGGRIQWYAGWGGLCEECETITMTRAGWINATTTNETNDRHGNRKITDT